MKRLRAAIADFVLSPADWFRASLLYRRFFGAWRARTARIRRERYEFLKEQISKRHFGGFAGLIVDFPGRKFDLHDVAAFRPPMYQVAQNQHYKWCIFWDRVRLTQEIGTGLPLQPGERPIQDNGGRTKPSSTLETIDERKPLTEAEPADDSDEAV